MAKNDINEFYRALGQALSEWQYIEAELFWMYSFFLGRVGWQIASASFYSHHTFRGKTRLVKSTGKMYFERNIEQRTHSAQMALRKQLKELNSLLNKCEHISNKRNDLAHHMVSTDDDGSKPKLAPPYPARPLRNTETRSTEDIQKICREFTDLADEIWFFNQSFWHPMPQR